MIYERHVNHPSGCLSVAISIVHSFRSLRFVSLDDEQVQPAEVTAEQKRQMIRKQLDYYFSEKNMMHDEFLMTQMDHEDYVSIATIANFKMMRRLTNDLQLIVDVLKGMFSTQDEEGGRSTSVCSSSR